MSGQDDVMTFSVMEAVTVQRELRRTMGMEAERVSLPAFVGMISDEIEQLRDRGHSDADIAAVIRRSTGRAFDPADLVRFYVTPAGRQGHGGPG